MYLSGLPGFVKLLHPEPPRRFGKAQSSLLPEPVGSSPVPKVGVNGTPVLTVKITPNCQPSVNKRAAPLYDFGAGSSQRPFMTKVCDTLKSDRPRLSLGSKKNCKLAIELPNASPATVAELVSICGSKCRCLALEIHGSYASPAALPAHCSKTDPHKTFLAQSRSFR